MIHRWRPFDPHSIRLVIFDLDGTLIDSRLDLVHSVNAALRHIERPELPGEVIASYVGDGAPLLIQRALGAEASDEALVRKGLEFFLAYYREHKLDYTQVYDGLVNALTSIRQSLNGTPRKMAVLTNKPRKMSVEILEALGLLKYFRAVYGGNSFETKKPDPLGARTILREFGAAPAEAILVGDSEVDVQTARNAGTLAAAVNYGFGTHDRTAHPADIYLNRLTDLVPLLVEDNS